MAADNEYIERGELENRINKYVKCKYADKETLEWAKDECIRQAHCMPAADVVPVVHGEWIKAGVGITERIVCSACNSSKGYFGRPPFCNQCGAKMDGERKDIP